MLVKEQMTRNLEIAPPDMPIVEVARRMKQGDFGVMPVGEENELIGMITDRDIVIRAVAEDEDLTRLTAEDIMTEGVLFCYEDQEIDEVVDEMGDSQVRRLVVLDRDQKCAGILSIGDIALAGVPKADQALGKISRPVHNEPQARH